MVALPSVAQDYSKLEKQLYCLHVNVQVYGKCLD